MNFIYIGLINGKPTVANISDFSIQDEYKRIEDFKAGLVKHKDNIIEKYKYELIGNVPDGWVVGEMVKIEMGYQSLEFAEFTFGREEWEDCDYERYQQKPENKKRIVAKPTVVEEKKNLTCGVNCGCINKCEAENQYPKEEVKEETQALLWKDILSIIKRSVTGDWLDQSLASHELLNNFHITRKQ